MLTKAQRNILRRFADRGGEGIIDRHGDMVAAGEKVGGAHATYLRLASYKMIAPAGPLRFQLTARGRAELEAPDG